MRIPPSRVHGQINGASFRATDLSPAMAWMANEPCAAFLAFGIHVIFSGSQIPGDERRLVVVLVSRGRRALKVQASAIKLIAIAMVNLFARLGAQNDPM
jgi:hypothetical protein